MPLFAASIILAVWLWGRKQLRSQPFDNPMSDFAEQDRTCPFGCGCRGASIAGGPFSHGRDAGRGGFHAALNAKSEASGS